MDVMIRKVGERDGKERFELVNVQTGDVITSKDASESSVRRYFKGKGLSNKYLDECFQKARARLQESQNGGRATDPPGSDKKAAAKKAKSKKSEPAKNEDDDLLFELGLEDS